MTKTVEIKPEHVKRFKRYAQQLNKLMYEIKEYAPEANLYAEDSNNLLLMKGDTHGEKGTSTFSDPQYQNIVHHAIVNGLSGGGW